MRRRTLVVGAALLVALAAAAGAATARHTLSLGASADEVTVGDRVRLGGKLERRGSGAPVAGRRVALQADPFPFGEWRTVARTRTGERGRYRFAQRPRRNTRYRAIAGTTPLTATGSLTVFADLAGAVRSFTIEGDRATVRAFIVVPRYAHLPGRRMHFYVYDRDRARGRHVGSAVLRRGSGRRWTAAVQFDASGVTARSYAGFCIREDEQDGWGRLRRIDRICGRAHVPKQ
jgi:hypothetical protein